MTTIKLNRYYPYLTENITLEVSMKSPLFSPPGAACATAISAASGSMTSAPWTLTLALSRM